MKKTDLQINWRARAEAVTHACQITQMMIEAELRAKGYKPENYAWMTETWDRYMKYHLEQAAADVKNYPDFARRVAKEIANRLSPKALERLRRHHVAVRTLAQMWAKKATLAQLRAQGLRLQQFSAKDLALLAEEYLAQHRAELVAEAERTIATSPDLTRWCCAKLSSNAQETKAEKSMGSTVQMLGAK